MRSSHLIALGLFTDVAFLDAPVRVRSSRPVAPTDTRPLSPA
ncbi:hypothetical protein [Streptomyces sp. NPDC093514]